MPIDYSEYHPKWSLISRLIRFKRADNKCEWCGVPNHKIVFRDNDGWHVLPDEEFVVSQAVGGAKLTKVVLTVAHVDRDKTNNRFNNLAALCQKCHLNHDRHQHIENRKYGRNWKKNQMSIDFK